MHPILVAAVFFTLGYAAHAVRPLHRLDNWAWAQVDRRVRDWRRDPDARRRPGWWAAQVVFAVECAAILAVRPRRTVRRWREVRAERRTGPVREPAPEFDPEWAAKRRGGAS